MGGKTHTTALVLIPPEEFWEPIQEIRRRHDRQFRRWMPHVTVLYPFRARKEFDSLTGPLERICRAVRPFELELAEFRWFSHGRESFTLWLAPEPAGQLKLLQEALWRVVPDCDDVRRFAGGFAPHLSVGQVRDRRELETLTAALRSTWRPLRFLVEAVSMIWRGRPPDDVFRVDRLVRIG